MKTLSVFVSMTRSRLYLAEPLPLPSGILHEIQAERGTDFNQVCQRGTSIRRSQSIRRTPPRFVIRKHEDTNASQRSARGEPHPFQIAQVKGQPAQPDDVRLPDGNADAASSGSGPSFQRDGYRRKYLRRKFGQAIAICPPRKDRNVTQVCQRPQVFQANPRRP